MITIQISVPFDSGTGYFILDQNGNPLATVRGGYIVRSDIEKNHLLETEGFNLREILKNIPSLLEGDLLPNIEGWLPIHTTMIW